MSAVINDDNKEYLKLIKRFPLRPIGNNDQNMLAVVNMYKSVGLVLFSVVCLHVATLASPAEPAGAAGSANHQSTKDDAASQFKILCQKAIDSPRLMNLVDAEQNFAEAAEIAMKNFPDD